MKLVLYVTFILIEYSILLLLDFLVRSDGLHQDISPWRHLFRPVATRKGITENRAQRVVSLWRCVKVGSQKNGLKKNVQEGCILGHPALEELHWGVSRKYPAHVEPAQGMEMLGQLKISVFLKNYTCVWVLDAVLFTTWLSGA